MTQINRRVFHVHKLGELILLKSLYTQSNPQIQCKLYQNSSSIFHRNIKNNPKICVESPKAPSCQSNLEQEEQIWRHHISWFQTVLQSYSNQNSIVFGGDVQDGGGVRRRDHLPPHKYIKNTSTCGTTPTEHPLNAGRRPQTSQKARKYPCTRVGQKKKKEKMETKE